MEVSFNIDVDEDINTISSKNYKVIAHNNNTTPFDLVENILVTVFKKNKTQSKQIAMAVHKMGKATVAVYPQDIANYKAKKAMELAEMQFHPELLFTVEQE